MYLEQGSESSADTDPYLDPQHCRHLKYKTALRKNKGEEKCLVFQISAGRLFGGFYTQLLPKPPFPPLLPVLVCAYIWGRIKDNTVYVHSYVYINTIFFI